MLERIVRKKSTLRLEPIEKIKRVHKQRDINLLVYINILAVVYKKEANFLWQALFWTDFMLKYHYLCYPSHGRPRMEGQQRS